MDPLVVGGLVALCTIIVLFSGVSVGTGLLLVATGFLFVFDGARLLVTLPELMYRELNSFALPSILMFIIMGAAISSTCAGPDLYEALERWLTKVPGGLVVSNLGACALFAAMSGSSPATKTAIGKTGIPEMRKRGYSDEVAARSIAAGGTLGILIPTFVTMIVYGVATLSETVAVGALLCILVAMIVYRLFEPQALWASLRDSTKESVMILFFIGAAGVFSLMLSLLFVTQSVAIWIADLDVNRWVLMGIINLFLLVAGFFLPPVAVILKSAPVLLPIITTAGFDAIWFAVILTINMEIGRITPPFGLNLHMINGIAPDISLKETLVGSMPFVGRIVLAITSCVWSLVLRTI